MNARTILAGLFVAGSLSASQQALANVYPTEVVADYVIGCMASNGGTQEMLRRCACSIDTVASILPYDAYEKADTVIRMQMVEPELRLLPLLQRIAENALGLGADIGESLGAGIELPDDQPHILHETLESLLHARDVDRIVQGHG